MKKKYFILKKIYYVYHDSYHGPFINTTYEPEVDKCEIDDEFTTFTEAKKRTIELFKDDIEELSQKLKHFKGGLKRVRSLKKKDLD